MEIENLQFIIVMIVWLPLFWFIVNNSEMPLMPEAGMAVIFCMPFALIAIIVTSGPLGIIFFLIKNWNIVGVLVATATWLLIVHMNRFKVFRFINFIEEIIA